MYIYTAQMIEHRQLKSEALGLNPGGCQFSRFL